MSRTNSLYTLNEAGRPVPARADEILAAARQQMSRRMKRGDPCRRRKQLGTT